jgi:hypothetical protein
VYLVAKVDLDLQRLKLISTGGMPHVIPDVPIAVIHELVVVPSDRLQAGSTTFPPQQETS